MQPVLKAETCTLLCPTGRVCRVSPPTGRPLTLLSDTASPRGCYLPQRRTAQRDLPDNTWIVSWGIVHTSGTEEEDDPLSTVQCRHPGAQSGRRIVENCWTILQIRERG
jgi:hypothetical protein